jgi:transmembrane sensor
MLMEYNDITSDELSLLLSKYKAGNITTEEFDLLKEAVNNRGDAELRPLILTAWQDKDNAHVLSEGEKQLMYDHVINRITSKKFLHRFTRVLRYAAFIAFILAAGYLVNYFTQSYQFSALSERQIVVKTGKSERTTVTLPDGTTVKLNAESSLAYKQSFGLKDREVNLNGEGFFSVSKDLQKMFSVRTQYLTIQVFGTKFNVFTYDRADSVEMALVQGHVKVVLNNDPSETLDVTPNQKVVFNKQTGKMTLISTNNNFETAWITNELVFRSVPLKNVISLVSRKYGVKFKVVGDLPLNDLYTGVFDENDINEVLDILKINFKFKYRIKDDMVLIYY